MKSISIARRAVPSVLAASAMIALAGCAGSVEASDTKPATESTGTTYPLTIDNCGQEVTIAEEPRSILTIGTSALSLLDAAGASDRIVARSGEFGAEIPSDLTTDLDDVTIVDPSDPSTEKIVGANADIVIGYGLFKSTDEDLAASGITNIVIDGECSHDAALTEATDFDAIFADIERLGTIFNTTATATANVKELSAELESMKADAATGAPRTAAVVYYFSPASTLSARGGQGIANDILSRAGLSNIYAEEPSVYLETNIETLLDADPEVIVLAFGLHGEDFEAAKAQLLKEPGAGDLTAVKNGALVGVPASDLSPDPDAIRGLRALLKGTGAATP